MNYEKLKLQILEESGVENLKAPDLNLFVIAFTSRTGSTFLADYLMQNYKIGVLAETLKQRYLERKFGSPLNVLEAIEKYREGDLFSFKGNTKALIFAEILGLLNQFNKKINCIYLARRDIVSQAISLVKAKQSNFFHKKTNTLDSNFDKKKIDKSKLFFDQLSIENEIKIIVNSNIRLINYLFQKRISWQGLFYEDFKNGDFSKVISICDSFGLPKHSYRGPYIPKIQIMSDDINKIWKEKFVLSEKVKRNFEKYEKILETVKKNDTNKHIDV